jgi:hypothetical protein
MNEKYQNEPKPQSFAGNRSHKQEWARDSHALCVKISRAGEKSKAAFSVFSRFFDEKVLASSLLKVFQRKG